MKTIGLMTLFFSSTLAANDTLEIENDLNYILEEKSVTADRPDPEDNVVLQVGVTTVKFDDAQISVLAEQRHSDKMVQIVIVPKVTSGNYSFSGARFGFNRQQKAVDDPIAQVRLFVTKEQKPEALYRSLLIPVIVKAVDNFSIEAKAAQSHNQIVLHKRLPQMIAQ